MRFVVSMNVRCAPETMNQMNVTATIMNVDHDLGSLRGVDLNLLAAFDALAEAGSVTRAAELAGVTQSAMSHTLRRLRELLDDPLLVRGHGRMVLTPRAEALRGPLRAALGDMARAITTRPDFDASTSTRAFRLVGPDLFDVLALPPLLRRLGQEAPGVSVVVLPMPANLPASLEAGDIDLAISPVQLNEEPFDRRTEPGPDLQRRTLLRDKMRCFARRGHPGIAARGRMTLTAFTKAAHVLVSPSGAGQGLVDRVLAAQNTTRRIAVRVPQFSTALAIVAETDLVLTAPSALGAVATAEAALVSLTPPIKLPEHAVAMVWHPRFSEDPAHQWFRSLVATVSGEMCS